LDKKKARLLKNYNEKFFIDKIRPNVDKIRHVVFLASFEKKQKNDVFD
jgi:hypothetical protein